MNGSESRWFQRSSRNVVSRGQSLSGGGGLDPAARRRHVRWRPDRRRAAGRELLRRELGQFVLKPGAQGRLRLEAARGHDDLVIATALAVLAADLAAFHVALIPKPFAVDMR